MKKKVLHILFFMSNHFIFGQFIYTGYQQAESWIVTNQGNLDADNDSTNLWQNYKFQKKINYNNDHHFGIFVNLHNSTDSKIISSKSNLIGNGMLTNYNFNLSGIEIANSMFFSNSRQELDKGFVRTIKDVSMYTNQAYLRFSNKISSLDYALKIGRDFLVEGYGIGSKLFFSDFSRPFDQLSLEANYKNLNGKFTAINLDNLFDHNRFLYMHSLKIIKDNFSITFGESIISTGVEESINIKYLNPFNFWAWENLGSLNKGLNAFLYFGLDFLLKKSNRFYGEILFDDINFHTKNAFYLNKYAYLIGFQKTSFPFSSSNIWIEHTNVLNQVYQSYHPTHIYTHRGHPIGHYLGNDFINSRIHYSQIFESLKSKAFFDLSYLIQGKNNINTPFENPWEDNEGNLINNYIHPGFPTPPVTRIIDINFGIEISLKNLTTFTIAIENQKISQKSFIFKIKLSFWSYLNFI